MKRIVSVALLIATSILFSCSSDDSASRTDTTDKEGQYLVMFYGVGGGNLDGEIISNILQSLTAGSSDKVKMAYQFRCSKHLQQYGDNCENVRRFTADDNSHFKDKLDPTAINVLEYDSMKTTPLGDESYIMASDTALTSFIKWSKATYPKATKTILIISDHGGGWSLTHDGQKDFTTRAILYDNNTTNDKRADYLSLNDVVCGIQNGGKVDVLYTDACMMSLWENLTGYSQATNYYIGSMETSPGAGGNYYYLVKRLEENSVSDEGMEKAFRSYTDDIIDSWWPLNETKPLYTYQIYGDMDFMDLTKIASPLQVIANINKTLVEKWNSTDAIPGVSPDATYGNQWKNYIRVALTLCELATNSTSGDKIDEEDIPEPMMQYIVRNNEKKYYYDVVLKALKKVDWSTCSEEYLNQYKFVWNSIAKTTHDSYCYAYILCQLNYALRDAGLSDNDNPFFSLYTQYIDALKECSYIRCTHALSEARSSELGMSSYEYDTCSPGIFIYPFNKNIYDNKDVWGVRYNRDIPDVNTAISYYSNTAFDSQTLWSSFLRLIDVLPNVIQNPARENIK